MVSNLSVVASSLSIVKDNSGGQSVVYHRASRA